MNNSIVACLDSGDEECYEPLPLHLHICIAHVIAGHSSLTNKKLTVCTVNFGDITESLLKFGTLYLCCFEKEKKTCLFRRANLQNVFNE